MIHRTHPGMPDATHLHQMIYGRLVRWAIGSDEKQDIVTRNSLTAPYLWLLTTMAVIPAVLFWDNAWLLRGFMLLFCLSYVMVYRRLVQFKTPAWLTLTRRK
jgi:small-conductance mechanosensitive channel